MERTENHPFESFHYCPRCGARFVRHNEKAYHCEGCGFVYYFNPSAATVAVIVNERNELLVCVRAKEPAKGTLDLPGGFCDMHESAEQGVAREVLEETGMRVTETKYLFSLPNTYLYSGFVVHTIDAFFLCSEVSVFAAQHVPIQRIRGAHDRCVLPVQRAARGYARTTR